MREVAILGIGQVPIGEHWDQSGLDLAGKAVLATLHDAAIERVDSLIVGSMLATTQTSGNLNLGAKLADWCGLQGVEAIRVEAACGSGGAAFRNGVIAVGSGMVDLVLVVGVEKMTEMPGPEITAALATAADADYEVAHGLSFVGLNALLMQRYLYEFGWERRHFGPFSINAHQNAFHNPFAQLRSPIDEQEYRQARMICDPITILDASPIGDGAAAVLLGPPAYSNTMPGRPSVNVIGSASATDSVAIHDRKDPLWLMAAEVSARQAYRQAGLGPDGIDFFELHDAFSIMAALSLEACGFADRGRGPRLALEADITPSGRLPICTHGGLKARGHPVGATGIYQIVEVVRQLRGDAGDNQLDRARVGMAQNIGGSGATVQTHILRAQ